MRLNSKQLKLWLFFMLLGLTITGAVIFEFKPGKFGVTRDFQVSEKLTKPKEPNMSNQQLSKQNTPLVPVTSGQSVVAIVQSKEKKAENIKYPEIKAMVQTAVDMAGGFDGLIKNGQTVVIKPNLVTHIDYTLPGWQGKLLAPKVNGTTTDYRVTRAIVELIRRYNPDGKVYIMEGSAFSTPKCMKQLNYTPEYIPGVDEFIAIEDSSGNWGEYDSPYLVKVPVKDYLLKKEVYMNKLYQTADVVISVPVLKTHWTEIVSGSIKNVGIGATPANIYGGSNVGMLNRSPGIDHTKEKLDQWIHDWFMARPIEFTIIDGLQGIQNGPTPCYEMTKTTDIRQDQMNSRLILASRDCVAADTVSALVMQWDPQAVKHLVYLEKSGAGHCNVSKIHVSGKRVAEVRQDFKGTSAEGKFRVLTAPKITLQKTDIAGDLLHIQLSAAKQTVKIEVYVDDTYVGTVSPVNPENCTIEVKGFTNSKTKRNIALYAFDGFLNCNGKQIQVP